MIFITLYEVFFILLYEVCECMCYVLYYTRCIFAAIFYELSDCAGFTRNDREQGTIDSFDSYSIRSMTDDD
jgi:hypothetical protein